MEYVQHRMVHFPTWYLLCGDRQAGVLSPVFFYLKYCHMRTAVPHCVNGDIAIQWKWSNFDPSQKPNPLTDYDKTLYNW